MVRTAARRRPRPVAYAEPDPLYGLLDEDLELLDAAIEAILKARAPKPPAGTAERWERPIRRELRRLSEDVGDAIDALEVRRSWWVRKADPSDFSVKPAVWSRFERELGDVLEEMYGAVGEAGFAAVAGELGIALDYGIRQEIADPVLDEVGRRVTMISDASRNELADAVGTATSRGYSVEQLVRGVAGDGFSGLRPMVDRWQAIAPVSTSIDRATLIARTETANAYNLATMDAYRASNLVAEVNVFDGGNCGWTTHTDPDLANGSRRTLDEARAHPTAHPSCQRAFGAIVRGAPPPGSPYAQRVTPPQVGPRPTADALELRARAIQARAFSSAEAAEKAVTSTLRDLETRTGGTLAGLNFRLKIDGERTVEKVLGDVAAGDPIERARQVKDALRYTLIYPEDRLWAGARAVEAELTRLGYSTIKWKPNWTNPLSRDLNTAFRAPNGSRFELQFHTPTSFERKMNGGPGGQRPSHEIYTELRSLPQDAVSARRSLEDELRALWADVPIPAGEPYFAEIVEDLLP